MGVSYLSSFVNLFYPKLCICCDEESYSGQLPVCIYCLSELPLSEMENHFENSFTERVYGRIQIQTGCALFFFSKGGKVQQLIHKAKYSGDGQIAKLIGSWMGKRLLSSELYKDIDLIIPVPLHNSKRRSRGFNQSEAFAEGISEILKVPCKSNALKRSIASISQISKNRLERLNNVLESFELDDQDGLEGKHILLVDDVLTTGATLEACSEKLLTIPKIKLSLCTIALAMD